MGIVINQSIKNTVITYIGFAIGAINVLFLFTNFMSDTYFGLITFILSTSNILMPLMAFGVHNAIVKFYSSFKTRQTQNSFLLLMLVLPLVLIIPLGLIGSFAYNEIGEWLSKKNPIVKEYTWLIYISAITFAYFEIFYSWTKVQMNSVFGNFMKEVFHRICITILLLCLYAKFITVQQLIYGVVGVYFLRMLIMKIYAFSVRRPLLKFSKINNLSAVLKYALLIILAGSVANIILEIDKFMIGQYIEIKNVAYYGVAIYIASVIAVPSRAMHQITNPLTAKLLNQNNKPELKSLYQKSSLNLFIVSGFIFIIILININALYLLIPEKYNGGLLIVFLIGLTKLFDTVLGNNNAILFNSDYYRMVLFFGVFLAVSTIILNTFFIPNFGINGAAYATCIALGLYNVAKLVFVQFKFKMLPFTASTLKSLLLITVSLLLFYFWDFNFNPIINITLKTLLASLFYGVLVYKLNLSEDITMLLNKILKRN